MQAHSDKISTYRASSCTLCDEAERARKRDRMPSTRDDGRFDGAIVRGLHEDWATGRTLGEGAFAQVRLARGLKTGRIAAVKTTRISPANPRLLLFSLREALALAHLPSHPSIPPLLDFSRTAAETHLVQALAPGQELFTYVNSKPEGRLSEPEARRVVAGILSALRHAHAHGVLHRDLKLDNVFWDPLSGTASLIDFGLAAFFDGKTVLDEPVGCVNYASPSLARLTATRRPYLAHDGHTDLWALGVLAHGILTGYFPFRAEEPIELFAELADARVEMPGVSEEANDFVRTLLTPTNEGRIDAEGIARHAWVAELVGPEPRGSEPGSRPRIPSPMIDPRRSVKAAEHALDKVLRGHVEAMAPGELLPFDRAGSGSSLESTGTLVMEKPQRSEEREVKAEPAVSSKSAKPKRTLAERLNPARWFERIRLGRR